MQASKRVALNTGILYGRMILTMGISLYSTRIVLNGLGSRDYGIFNLIAGIIAMLSFLNAAMTTSTQRFLSFHQGKNDLNMQKKIFTNSLILHIIIGFIIVAGLEIAGLFLFNGFLKIPENRIVSAEILYHFMSATVFFTIITVPFTATLNARENMLWLALIGILEVFLKLGIALLVCFVLTNNKLVSYGLLTEGVSMLSFMFYACICLIKFNECTLKIWKDADKKLITHLSSFAGWNLFGSLCVLGKTQGIAVMLNVFFGTVVNAAYGIANQISSQMNFLSVTLLQAINPQIMKSQGNNDSQRMLRLSMIASKFCFFLMAMFIIPCIFEMKNILKFWLKDVPEYTPIFCILILISTLINQLTIGLQSAIQATGNIKRYQIVVGSIILLNLPISYLLLKLGFSIYIAILFFSIIEIIACLFRLYFAKKIAGLVISEYIHKVFFKEVIPVGLAIVTCYSIIKMTDVPFRFLFTLMLSVIIFIISCYFTGLDKDEKAFLNNFLVKLKKGS
jgi:O-antigen/teichoic acid export membrane protein